MVFRAVNALEHCTRKCSDCLMIDCDSLKFCMTTSTLGHRRKDKCEGHECAWQVHESMRCMSVRLHANINE